MKYIIAKLKGGIKEEVPITLTPYNENILNHPALIDKKHYEGGATGLVLSKNKMDSIEIEYMNKYRPNDTSFGVLIYEGAERLDVDKWCDVIEK
jgi:hypothetical protein